MLKTNMGRTILIVDDDSISRIIAKQMLEAEYNILEAENGAEALKILEKSDVSLILSDIQMDELDGWELMQAITKADRFKDIPVILMTADVSIRTEVKALDMGASDILFKPFVPKLMLSRINNALATQDAIRLSEQQRYYEMRLKMAEHDELTDLYNKQKFYKCVRERLDEDPAGSYAIMMWDTDNFKIFNDTLGVEAGDKLLCDIADALRSRNTEGTIYARYEADKFVICTKTEDNRISKAVDAALEWFDNYHTFFKLTGRIGIYVIENPGLEVSIMCDRALLAIRSIKESYTSKVAYYDNKIRDKIIEEQELSNDMNQALANNEFVLHFQPQYNYATKELIGAEALVRWQHPTKGLLYPDSFIPLFERNGFISSLDKYVWERSCRYLSNWLNNDNKMVPVSVSVNISRMDIDNPALCDDLTSLINKYHLPQSALKLEITETAYVDNPEHLIELVRELQDRGFTLEMDDFGSGYSSLNTLKDVPVDVLKLDTKFLSKANDDSRSGNILSSVIRMAHRLNLSVIAEGVETKEQADYLKSVGCRFMQGYLFAKPMPAEEFEKLLIDLKIGRADIYKDIEYDGMAAFWDPSAQMALLFNSFVGGAAIFEYHGECLEILRANDEYFRHVHPGDPADSYKAANILDYMTDESRENFIAMLEAASVHDPNAHCITKGSSDKYDHDIWILNRARMLTDELDGKIFYITVEDISESVIKEQKYRARIRELEEQLNEN
ncbi:MAG: EAL domain-containing protein [Eubacteriaceae bacterium]|jgi:diguanylate cyclase (GGDEF)-like protein|nr:EAL domain-containing protein [Eubacteriaceae bacterium]